MKAIFDKTTRLGPSARASESSGKLVNQMAADSQRFLFLMPPIQNLLCVPLYLGYVVTYLYILLGAFALTGLLVMLVSMIVSSFLARSLRRMQAQKSAAAGEWLPRQRPSLPLPLPFALFGDDYRWKLSNYTSRLRCPRPQPFMNGSAAHGLQRLGQQEGVHRRVGGDP